MASTLKNLDVDRVDAVDSPAHGSRFLILKSEDASALQEGVQKLADASETLVDAIATRKSANAIRKAARAVAEIIGKGEDTLTTLQDPGAGPDADRDPKDIPAEAKGLDRTAEDPVPEPATETTQPESPAVSHPSPEGDAGTGDKGMPAEAKGLDRTDEDPYKVKIDINKARFCVSCAAPVAKGKYVKKGKIAKAAECPMCGAPTDDKGDYMDQYGQDQSAQTMPTPTPAPAPAPAPARQAYPMAMSKADDEKPWDEDKKDDEKFDPDVFAEKMAAAVSRSVQASLTKFAESLVRPSAPTAVAKSRQEPTSGRAGSAKVSFTNLFFPEN